MTLPVPFAAASVVTVQPEWIDYNGHMNVGYYHVAFDLAADLAASCESLSSFVSQATRRTAPMPAALLDRLAAVKAAHAALPRPWQVGHVISAKPLR